MQGKHLYVGPIGFHGRPPSGEASDFKGLMITPGGLQGVRGGVGVSSESVQRPGEHGEFDLPVFKTARVVTVGGYAVESNDDALEQLGIVLGGLGAGGESMPIVYHGAGLVLHGRGRVISQEFEQAVSGIARATYSLSLSMRDPRWYGKTREFATSSDALVKMSHDGNVPAVPRFTVTGTFPNGYALHAAGRVVQVAGSASAINDVVDFRTGMVTRNGTLAPTLLQQAQFWSVPGGADLSWRLDRVGGTGSATAVLPATYM